MGYQLTDWRPGDSENVILGKLLQKFGGSPVSGDGTPTLLRKILARAGAAEDDGASYITEAEMNSAISSAITSTVLPAISSAVVDAALENFKDANSDADAVVYHTSGTVEAMRVVGATGFLQLTTVARIHRTADDTLFAFLGGTAKSKSAFCELYGQDHVTGLGGATFSIHDEGYFRVRSAPRDSTTSHIRWHVFGGTGDIEHTPTWNDVATTFVARYLNVTNTASAADSLLEELAIGGTDYFTVDINGDTWTKRNFMLTGGDASNQYFGVSDLNKYQPSNNSGHSNIAGAGSIYVQIDSNNDQADRVFSVRKDSQFAGGGTELFTVSETGDATLTGVLTLDNAVVGQAALTYAASVALDFDGVANQTISLTGDVEFTTSNRGSGKSLIVKILCDGTGRNFTLPAGWIFVGAAAPASIVASKTGVLSLTCFGSNDSDIVAVYTEEP